MRHYYPICNLLFHICLLTSTSKKIRLHIAKSHDSTSCKTIVQKIIHVRDKYLIGIVKRHEPLIQNVSVTGHLNFLQFLYYHSTKPKFGDIRIT